MALCDEFWKEFDTNNELRAIVNGERDDLSRLQYDSEYVRILLAKGFSEREVQALLIFNQHGRLWLDGRFNQSAYIRRISKAMAWG